MLTAWLEYHRATLAIKCQGLTPDDMRERAVLPSSLTLLGLVRHMTEVERHWFRRTMAGEEGPPLYYSDDNPDGDFDDAGSADAVEGMARWHAECEHARQVVAAIGSLDDMQPGPGQGRAPVSLRWVLIHMIEEYARHNGHADLLRERIDGATGE
jgi:uncharacterized damage-inducible protein DinB